MRAFIAIELPQLLQTVAHFPYLPIRNLPQEFERQMDAFRLGPTGLG